MSLQGVENVRNNFRNALQQDKTTEVKGIEMIEILNCAFIADEPYIFGTPNVDWNNAEFDWYMSQSLNINDIFYTPIPKAWKAAANKKGESNSNYGYRLFHDGQYQKMINQLIQDPTTRQAVAVYMPTDVHTIAVEDGKNDFICTFAT